MPREKKESEVKEVKTKDSTKKKDTSKTKDVDKEKQDQQDVIALLMKQVEELQKQLNQNKKEEVVIEEKEVKPKNKKRASFQDIRNEEVVVKRVIGGIGEVLYRDKKTGDEYVWNEEGDTEYMTVDVIKRMNSVSPLFLKAPWVRIDEEHPAIDVLGLRELYKNIDSIEDIDEFVKKSDSEILKIIKSLNQAYKDTLSTNISYKIASGELSDIHVIRRLEGLLGKIFFE